MVLADRGFDIADELALYGASLAIPPFTRGKDQGVQDGLLYPDLQAASSLKSSAAT